MLEKCVGICSGKYFLRNTLKRNAWKFILRNTFKINTWEFVLENTQTRALQCNKGNGHTLYCIFPICDICNHFFVCQYFVYLSISSSIVRGRSHWTTWSLIMSWTLHDFLLETIVIIGQSRSKDRCYLKKIERKQLDFLASLSKVFNYWI